MSLTPEEFRKEAHTLVDWMADYLEEVEQYPVKPEISPGEIFAKLPKSPPEEGEPIPDIFHDFQKLILPGMTHWQSPNFFAYFPANSSYPSLLAEMLTATLGAQCMIWDTSPAAAELEEAMMGWLKSLLHLPQHFEGVIQDTASTATLVALLTAREKASGFTMRQKGFSQEKFTAYCSHEAHSSVEKAIRVAGLGSERLHKIATDEQLALRPELLEKQIKRDKANGLQPLFVVAALGTTGTTAIDPLKPIAEICERYDIWLHVDAAYAGSLLALPEYQWMAQGMDKADSFVFNPHKWLFTHFDCSAYFVKDKVALIRTFEILPEYLKTKDENRVNNYKDWGIALGRRFRALKLWFVLRNFGAKKIRQTLRGHNEMALSFEKAIEAHPHFEMICPRTMNLVCFRYNPGQLTENQLNELNQKLMHQLNESGELYLTHTKVNGKFTLRFVTGNTHLQPRHVQTAWQHITNMAKALSKD